MLELFINKKKTKNCAELHLDLEQILIYIVN